MAYPRKSPAARRRSPKHDPPDPGAGQAVVQSFPFHGRIYELRKNSCGRKNCATCGGSRPAHGPYWYMCISRKGKWRRIYIGKDLDTTKFITADGKIKLPVKQSLRAEETPPVLVADDHPGQTRLFDEEDAHAAVMWTCCFCHAQILEGTAAHHMLVTSARCPACRKPVDVSLLSPCLSP